MGIFTKIFRSKLIAFLGMFVICIFAHAQTHIDTRTRYQTTTGNTINRAFAVASTTGNLIVVHLDWDNQGISVSSVTDNKGNTYNRINGPTNWNGTNYRAELWYAYNITGGGAAVSITGTLSGNPTSFSQIYITEYSGIVTTNPLDQNRVAAGSTLAVSTGTRTTTYTNELVYGAAIGASGLLTQGASFTLRSSANQNIIEDKNVATIGTYDANFTSASGFWVAQMATFITTLSLPVSLIQFEGQCLNDSLRLKWATASEKNNDAFIVQRSSDLQKWENMDTLPGAGNSNVIRYYSSVVGQAGGPISWIRLNQMDFNGQSHLSNIISIKNCEEYHSLKLWPNPSGSIVHLDYDGDMALVNSMALFNALGQKVWETDRFSTRLDLGHLAKGLYMLQIRENALVVQKHLVLE